MNRSIHTRERKFKQLNERLNILSEAANQRSLSLHQEEINGAFNLFVELLDEVTNGQQESSFSPWNVSERIQFIQLRPYSYHAYKQLCELTKELQKISVKKDLSRG